MKLTRDSNWSYLVLERNDKQMLENEFMRIKEKSFILGGAEHWFEALQRFLDKPERAEVFMEWLLERMADQEKGD